VAGKSVAGSLRGFSKEWHNRYLNSPTTPPRVISGGLPPASARNANHSPRFTIEPRPRPFWPERAGLAEGTKAARSLPSECFARPAGSAGGLEFWSIVSALRPACGPFKREARGSEPPRGGQKDSGKRRWEREE